MKKKDFPYLLKLAIFLSRLSPNLKPEEIIVFIEGIHTCAINLYLLNSAIAKNPKEDLKILWSGSQSAAIELTEQFNILLKSKSPIERKLLVQFDTREGKLPLGIGTREMSSDQYFWISGTI
jgi:hypothetical protein